MKEMKETAIALKKILNPKSIAVVGASNNFINPATNLMASVISSGYEGIIYPIHPKEKSHSGSRSILSLPIFPAKSTLPLL